MGKDRNLKMRGVTFFLIIQVGLAGLATGWAAGQDMAAFSLPGIGDSPLLVSSGDHQDKVLLVNFWATWCPPCRREIPSLVHLQEENRDKGFTVIGISMDKSDKAKVSAFVKKLGVNYPVALANKEVARSFGAMGTIPSSFLVDANGKIVKRYPGYTTYEKMAKDVAELLE